MPSSLFFLFYVVWSDPRGRKNLSSAAVAERTCWEEHKKKKRTSVRASFLSLARTSDRAVGTTSRGGRAAIRLGGFGSGSTNGGDLRVPHFDQGLATSVATRTTRLASLVVGGNVKRDEQHQVGRDDDHTGECSKFLTSALAGVGHAGEVGAGEVGVRGEVDETCIFD